MTNIKLTDVEKFKLAIHLAQAIINDSAKYTLNTPNSNAGEREMAKEIIHGYKSIEIALETLNN